MSKRRYTNMQVLLPTIEKMLESGKNHREIEAELGLEGTVQLTKMMSGQAKQAPRVGPKLLGRKHQKPSRK